MKAVVFEDTRRVAVQDVEDAALEEPTDAIVRLTSSAICGTDLHSYDGRTGAEPGLVIGHEPLSDAPAFFDSFDRRADGVIKAVLLPGSPR
jgi:threonine dehydrogenase-like Zn-dependent dehydrogenase